MDKETILDNFAKAYQAERFPPVSGKIMGLFMLSGQQYLSFEEIQDQLGISKSALSKNLNLLIEVNRVTFKKDPNSPRRRLFCLDIPGTKIHIYNIVKNFEFQNSLLLEAKKHRINGNEEVDDFINNSLEFSEEIINELKISIPKYFKS